MKVIIFDVGQTLCRNQINYLDTCKNIANSALLNLKSVIGQMNK